MMKISALNEAPQPRTENDDEDGQTITKEAQEQIALTEYNRALELMKSNKAQDALTIFEDLLDTELLDQVEKSEKPEGKSRPMLSLKYSCYKNIGAIQASLGYYEKAIENYWEAANLDDTDVTLWYRIGCLATTTSNLELACSSFRQGLKCNPNHWPCLDNIISVLYAVPDYMNCLLFVSMALERDPGYVKGLAFREKIFREIPHYEECYKIYNVDWALDPPMDTDYDHTMGEKLLDEAKIIAEKWADSCKTEFERKPLPILHLIKPLAKLAWLELGDSLVAMHKWMAENCYNFVSRVTLDFQRSCDDEEAPSGPPSDANPDEDYASECDSTNRKLDPDPGIEIDAKTETDIEEMDVTENSDDQRVPNAEFDPRLDLEEDGKSASSEIQTIEDEDPFKIPSVENARNETRLEEKSANDPRQAYGDVIIVRDDEEIVKSPREKMADANNCDKSSEENAEKSNTASSDKSTNENKSNEKTNAPGDVKEEGQKVKKRRRSSLCFLQQWAWSSSSMRRSARVRGSSRREAERDDVQLEETLRRMFPSTLLPDGVKLTKEDPFKNIDDSMDTMDVYQLFANREKSCNLREGSKSTDSSKPSSPEMADLPLYFGTEAEKMDVEEFINEHSGKSNLMIIIAKYTEFLSTKWNHDWPKDMTSIYIQAYTYTREHIPHRSPFDVFDEDHGILKYDAEMTLLFGELHTDRWMDERPEVTPTSNLDKVGTGMPSEELGHIIFASVRDDLFSEENMTYLVRVLWLKANIFHCQGDNDIVIETLESLLTHMDEYKRRRALLPPIVRLPNCKYNARICIPVIEKTLTMIRRGQRLADVQRLHDEKKYAELAATLKDTFKFAKQQRKLLPHIKVTTERIDQLSMLLDSLWRLEHYEECYVWSETCLNESWQNYLNAGDEAEQKKWSSSVFACLEKLEACVNEVSTFVMGYLPETRLARLVQNLVQMVCHQLDVTSENNAEMSPETVLPWILLHHVLQYEEDKGRAKSPSQKTSKEQNSDDEDEDEDIPSSIMILLTAHEYLGRHSWCCVNNAKLLLFIMKLVIPRLRTPQFATVRDKLARHIEQIFYCLYGHPNKEKRTKPKYLEDHRVPQIELTWEGAQLLFDFYRPDQLPEFDTPRAASINAETHSLFKKVVTLVPDEHDPSQKIDEVTAYIVGERDAMPTVKKPLPYQVSSIYALLGDYLFKYNQYANSTCYFLMDLCLHPEAFNSWATLAMVMGTEFGTALTSCKPLPDTKKLLFDAKMAQFCYQRAVELVPAQSVIWIEYGTFAYTVHSFCSRLLKQETDTLSMEKFAALESRKETTLEIAVNCFISANRVFLSNIDDNTHAHDERWLYHYMLAKIAEKKNEDPPVYLDHYSKASNWLRKNSAQYPPRIPHKNPSYLSVEALEVHYRIHACILKYLEQHEGKPLKKSVGQVFLEHLTECANGPFMQYESRLTRPKGMDSNGYPEVVVMHTDAVAEVPRSRTGPANAEKRLNSVEEIPPPEKQDTMSKSSRNETRKRQADGHQQQEDNAKRIKLGSVSHLELMQDVVGMIDDLITNVCEIAANREASGDEITILSSDESEKAQKFVTKQDTRRKEAEKCAIENERSSTGNNNNNNAERKANSHATSPGEKSANVQDLMDELMKRTMELSDEINASPLDDEETRKSEGKWLMNDEAQCNETRYNNQTKESVKESRERNEKKKTQVNAVKDEGTLSRRGSQESTTTTQTTTTNTETNNSSSSSSDESSSSDDSSESDTSSDSDSESLESDNNEKKKATPELGEKEEYLTDAEVAKLIAYCIAGLEQCVLRFPEHYKSIYRLCHYYFNSKVAKDNAKCRDLFLGTYRCQYYTGRTVQGLFADRKNNNFFNGVWRNPIEEIDRPGSFASHMSRCVTLLMQILKETDDSLMLLDLYVQLRRLPDPDKKYLRDSEREQLSRQALSLCIQSLRTRLQNMTPPPQPIDNMQMYRSDPRKQVLLDVYKIYREIQKIYAPKDSTIQTFSNLLVDTYKAYTGVKNVEGNVIEVALKCCQQVMTASKMAESNPLTSSGIAPVSAATSSSPIMISQPQSLPTSPQTSQPRKPPKSSTSTGRPRGRPPNVNKYLQAMQQTAGLTGQFPGKSGFANYLGVGGNNALMSAYFMNPLMDPSMLSAVFAAGMSSQLDPLAAVNYFNQLGNYQDILRQYQNNLSSMTNLGGGAGGGAFGNAAGTSNLSNTAGSTVPQSMSPVTSPVNASSANLGNLAGMANLSGLTVQQLLNLSNSSVTNNARPNSMYNQTAPKTVANVSATKEAPCVSITPVTSNTQQQQQQPTTTTMANKTKTSKHPSSTHIEPMPMPAHLNKSVSMTQQQQQQQQPPPPPLPPSTTATTTKNVAHGTSAQVSLLKPSVIAQTKIPPPKQMSAPQIRVSKSLTEPQPAHNSSHPSLGVSSASVNPANVLQSPHGPLQAPGTMGMKSAGSMVMPGSRPGNATAGTSLQHKLLSKKMAQQAQPVHPVKPHVNPSKKKTGKSANIPQLPTNLQTLLSTMSGGGGSHASLGQPPPPFIPQELSGISVSPVGPSVTKPPPPPKHPPYRKVTNNKGPKGASSGMEITASMQNALPATNTAETLSMLTQLQQHSHLEIIPQQKGHGKTSQMDYAKSMPLSLSIVPPQKIIENARPTSSECMSVYELPRNKNSAPSQAKKNDAKHAKDSVEIITLDD